ncbi:type I-E CRISPR-associated protein Cas7/Cse4/CasC [Nocardioides acrostichi]|uniref:Type I-E CRISPR-associated protein Cas7/Cse4/CasC n=1 Tax=Nocardioides acrostichi TaxID=2784339 RepID=A0A930YE16_9ACTN|nr:type I-E CRISPR-associated protein Cas7/Cse4/CasC [Nocardioides acrostichi]MBF4163029.1 type I-E CRISPR-associated protein Cas7/Cse4/CasC [Nocardioides acrostichi]
MTTFIDLHVLQTVPSSNINRDDSGSPKSAIFGGVRRARVSSQAWKRATRKDFAAYLDDSDRGIRSRRIMGDLVRRIRALDSTIEAGEALDLAKAVMSAASTIKFEKPKRKKDAQPDDPDQIDVSQYLLFLSNQQLAKVAELAVAARGGKPDRVEARAALKDGNGIEVALFGRMVADDTAFNVDAAVQVAHALSTHAVETEYDYYTAVDDAKDSSLEGEDAGAGMIGVIEFNSSTLYRYATINVDQLMKNLGAADVTGRAVEAFVRSFIVSMPTGKLNTFANNTLPDAVVAQVRTRRPVNLCGAFESAVITKPDESISQQSALALANKAAELDEAYGTAPETSLVLAVGDALGGILSGTGERVGLNALVATLGESAQNAAAAIESA